MLLKKNKQNKALAKAVHAKEPEKVSQLLEDGADPNYNPILGKHILATAIDYGTPQIVSILLDAGADPNAHLDGNSHDTTPVRKAINSDKPEMLEALLKHPKADIFQTASFSSVAGHFHHASGFHFDLPPAYVVAQRHNDNAMQRICEKYRKDEIAQRLKNKPKAP